ncbi:hypothetical protein FAZ69_27145 [Trinickia terrae]|uniref:Uncharacterized protein n=1 Tax=Trinickia terrae TaxID=2571161 RepID=A0A4U1HQ46_9BURK|nr:hypothetical protein [Trinickia terrae]TKC81644.1 hypothetical protein FAZ69_27145 [Trinickia terrae]
MKTLMIEDLSVAKQLDGREMSAVRGGYLPSLYPVYLPYPSVHVDTTNFSASQSIGQSNLIENNTGNNVAFASDIHSTVNPSQNAHNTINF